MTPLGVPLALLRLLVVARLRALCWSRRGLARCLGAVALLLAFQLSGVAPLLLGAAEDASCEGGACSGCPLEKAGNPCPPGCASCHSLQRSLAPLPQVQSVSTSAHDCEAGLQVCPEQASVPRAPPLSRVYRPPRSRHSPA